MHANIWAIFKGPKMLQVSVGEYYAESTSQIHVRKAKAALLVLASQRQNHADPLMERLQTVIFAKSACNLLHLCISMFENTVQISNLIDLSEDQSSSFIRPLLLWQQCVYFWLADSNSKELQDLERLRLKRKERATCYYLIYLMDEK